MGRDGGKEGLNGFGVVLFPRLGLSIGLSVEEHRLNARMCAHI